MNSSSPYATRKPETRKRQGHTFPEHICSDHTLGPDSPSAALTFYQHMRSLNLSIDEFTDVYRIPKAQSPSKHMRPLGNILDLKNTLSTLVPNNTPVHLIMQNVLSPVLRVTNLNSSSMSENSISKISSETQANF